MSAIPLLSHLGLVFAALLLAGTAALHAEDAVPAPTWTVPAGWVKAEGERPMRVATFTLAGGEVAVSQFSGNAGGPLANINRWRGQVGLAPVAEAELAEVAQKFEIPGFTGLTMHLKGADKHLLGAAIYEPKADRTWFIKLLGPAALADQQEAAFVAFAKSFTPAK
jgi:hypothetical protein